MFYLRKQLTFCDDTAGFDDRGTSAEISSDDATVPGSGMGSVSDWLKLAKGSTVISMEIQVCARRNQWWRREKSDFFSQATDTVFIRISAQLRVCTHLHPTPSPPTQNQISATPHPTPLPLPPPPPPKIE